MTFNSEEGNSSEIMSLPVQGDVKLLDGDHGAQQANGSLPPEPDSLTSTIPPTSSLLHRSLKDAPIEVTSASGIYLKLSDNRTIIDACTGAAVACLGHGHPSILAAVAAQMSKVSYCHTMTYTTTPAEELATILLKDNQYGLDKAYFVGSGSEAMDAALKLARQYFFELGDEEREKRVHYVSRRQSYHGNTIGAMSVSYNLPRKAPYKNLQLTDVSWVGPAYAYQYSDWPHGETEEAYADRLVRELEEEFVRVGPERVIAFIAEPVVGATSACTTAPKGYFRGVRRVCDKYGILLILDEIMCGTGRTGTFWAFEQEGVVPDILTMGKGLGGGFASIAAVVVGKKVIEGLRQGSGAFAHGHTYQAHPVNCAAALEVQRILARDGLVENAKRMGFVLEKLLREELDGRKYVGEIRGRGLFWGIEFVRDKTLREPFDPRVGFGARFQAMVFEHGVAVYPGAGTVNGSKGDHAILAPPYNVTEEELKTIVDVLGVVYNKLEAQIDGQKRGEASSAQTC